MARKIKQFRAVSLFSNCGAGDLGFRKAGFRFSVLAELDQRRLDVASLNHPEADCVSGDLRTTWKKVVQVYRRRHGGSRPDLLAACPPCQGMSSARSDRGLANDADAGSRDTRNLLVVPIANVAKKLAPRFIVVENVPAFLKRKVRHPKTGKPISAAKLLISLLEPSYVVFPLLADLCEYGVPQTRKRAFLTFIHRSEPCLSRLTADQRVPYPVLSHANGRKPSPIVLSDALAAMSLPGLDASRPDKARDHKRKLHFVPVWEDRRYRMVEAIPPRSGSSAWQNNVCENCGRVEAAEKRASCPKCGRPLLKPVVKSKNGRFRLVFGFPNTSYRRMSPDAPAATITTASGHIGSDLTIHPWENRLFSPLECALLQTIPRSFKWGRTLTDNGVCHLRDMIGEAVPPLFTRRHGQVIVGLLMAQKPPLKVQSMDQTNRRVARAEAALERPAKASPESARRASIRTP